MDIRIVVCDDNPSVLDALARAMSFKKGIEVAGVAATYEELREVVAAQRPDVILLDHNMPGTNGAQAVIALRSDGDDTPVVMMSADRRNEAPSMDAGAHAFFYKGTSDLATLAEQLRAAAASRGAP